MYECQISDQFLLFYAMDVFFDGSSLTPIIYLVIII